MIEITDHPEGSVLPVRAQPGARRQGIVGEQGGALKLSVTAPADQGKANKALSELIAELFGLKKSQVELLSGPTHRDKKFLLRGVGAAAMQAKLQKLIVT